MGNYQFINYFDKTYVYNLYKRIVQNRKPYEQVTRIKMLEAINGEYAQNPYIIEGCVSKEALSLLLDHIKLGKIKVKDKKHQRHLYFELNSVFLIEDVDYDTYVIPNKVFSIFSGYELSDEHETLDEVHDFIYGVILTHGSIGFNELMTKYLKELRKD
ncbi:hypothetical protein BN85301280 [Paracholeplasma brassicae]|uniref:Uncharacterized protein n=1 Tax=Acholeplasma brassicae TaxID=61635 RepID=U4KSL5_9MOLU|nr:hypothetical protein [Paracholeplasma brassicae]CCV65149.1 hypothetical protein BN85301280 [Paracholeplasma brassicae]